MSRYLDFYWTTMKLSVIGQFQYRVANYFYMIGMIAEPVIYLVVWSTIAQAQGGSVGGYTPGAFAAALVLGAIMIYSFWLILTSVAFWVVRADEMVNLFQGVYAAGRWPVGIYPRWLRAGLTFLVPVVFAVTVPAEALTQRLTPSTLAGATILAAALLALARLVWLRGLRAYSGASA